MASRRLTALTTVAVLMFASVAHAEPSAADRETARSLMQDARDRRDRNDMKGALERFKSADAIMRVPTTGIEVARTEESLGMLIEAHDTALRVMRAPVEKREPPPFQEARVAAQALADRLEGRIPAVTIVVKGAPDGVTPDVTIDDAAVPSAVIGMPRKVNPGHHVIVAKTTAAQGKQEVDVHEGETKDVSILLVVSGAVATTVTPPPPEETPPPAPPKRSHAFTYVAFGVAGVGVVAGSITGLLSLSKKSSLDSSCTQDHRCPPSAYSDLDGAKSMATISTISFIVAGVGAGAGIVSLFVGGKSSAEPPSDHVDGRSATQPGQHLDGRSATQPGQHLDGRSATQPGQHLNEARVEPWIGLGSVGVRGDF